MYKVNWGTSYVPVDDVKEVLHDSNLLEHKLHFPIHMLLKQIHISRFQPLKIAFQIKIYGEPNVKV